MVIEKKIVRKGIDQSEVNTLSLNLIDANIGEKIVNMKKV